MHGPLTLLCMGRLHYYAYAAYTPTFLLGLVFFRTALLCSGGYYLERGGMQLHGAVGINCEKSTTTENQGSGVKYKG